MKINRVNIGEIILRKVEERKMSQAEFAKQIGLHRQNVKKTVFDKSSIDTGLLCTISEVLGCNLFNYYRSNTDDDKKELKATLTIEIGAEKQDKTIRFMFGENNVELK
jgi:transcriptional regulator with XRE-family HTH domain